MPIIGNTNVLAIMRDNQALHVGWAEFAGHFSLASASVLEYYDQNGRRLVLLQDSGGDAIFEVDLRQPTVAANILLGRINTALDHLEDVVGEMERDGEPIGGGVPRPTGTLPEVFAQLSVAFDNLDPSPNKANWLHNLAHRAGLAH
jgi:hypothetical protein